MDSRLPGDLGRPLHAAHAGRERQGERVIARDGTDVTAAYRRGAEEALRLAKLYGARYALLKERSPSCGSGTIYDGTFTGRRVPGDGVTAGLLKANGIEVFGETELSEMIQRMKWDEENDTVWQ